MRYTPENITTLAENEVFVYGANENFRHGAGAAKFAMRWGAEYGKVGLQGKTWGIPTKDWQIKTLPLLVIGVYVHRFVTFAKINPNLTFLVTKLGTEIGR